MENDRPSLTAYSKELLDKIAAADGTAFGQVYCSFYKRLFQFALAIVKTREPAEEIVEDVFVRIWQQKTSLPSVHNLRVYLYTATKNASLNYLSKKARASITEPFDHIHIELNGSGISPEEILITTEMYRKLQELAKTYAQMGDYADCLTYCNKVINSGTYSLVSNFANLWGAANKNNSESIFELEANGTAYGFFGFEIFDYVASDGYPKRDIGSANLINAFKAAGDNGVRYQTTFTWQIPGAAFTMPPNAWGPNFPTPFMNKYPDADGYNSTDDIVLIRLADIILLAAEANNQTGNMESATAELNQIRTRAGLPNTTTATQSDLAMAILNERQMELVFECTRWNDLQRAYANGTLNIVTLMAGQTDLHGNNLNYNMAADKHQYIFPIPFEDIQLNKNLKQNPGY